MANDAAPHLAVITLQAQVHPLLPTGECSGTPTMKVKPFVLVLDGQDRAIAERQLNELLAELKQRCRPGK